MKDDKIMRRIRNLLAMAKDASSPQEAAIAASRARKLMDKHNLAEHEVEIDAGFATVGASDSFKPEGIPIWLNTLSTAVAMYNDCHKDYVIRNENNKVCTAFKGHKADAKVASLMYDYIATTLIKLAKQFYMSPELIEGFLLGASNVVQQRIMILIEKRKHTHKDSNGNALVPLRQNAVDEHFGKPEYTDAPDDEINDILDGYGKRKAYHNGCEHGHKVGLEPQLESSRKSNRK
jgi:hypothetical protein